MREYDQLVLAADLKGSLAYLDADEQERHLFGKIRHQPYYTVVSRITLPWLASGSVYYFADHQAPSATHGAAATDAGRATAGCPTIMLKANRGSNLTITWAVCRWIPARNCLAASCGFASIWRERCHAMPGRLTAY